MKNLVDKLEKLVNILAIAVTVYETAKFALSLLKQHQKPSQEDSKEFVEFETVKDGE